MGTEELCRLNIQREFCWVHGHAGIEGNETAVQLAKDAAAPQNQEELPSEEDRCTSLSHLRRCTTDAKWKRSDEWFEAKCKSKKYYHLDKQHKPNRTTTKTEKSTAQIFYQFESGPCPYWSIYKTDQERRKRQVLVVQLRCSTIARTHLLAL
jgi:hypothetical protein